MDGDGETKQFIPAKSWRRELRAVIWITAFTGWNILLASDLLFPKASLPPLPPSLPPSLFLSVITVFISAVPCSQSASSWWAYWQPHHSTLLSYWDVFAAFPVLYRSTPCSCACTSVCVCVSWCYWGNCYWLTLLWLHFFLFYRSHFFFFVGPHLPGSGKSREDVLIFVQKLSVLALVVHGAVGLWAAGHQHQSAAARGAVEEALRTAVGQVVPQVRIWCDSPAFSCFYLFFFFKLLCNLLNLKN